MPFFKHVDEVYPDGVESHLEEVRRLLETSMNVKSWPEGGMSLGLIADGTVDISIVSKADMKTFKSNNDVCRDRIQFQKYTNPDIPNDFGFNAIKRADFILIASQATTRQQLGLVLGYIKGERGVYIDALCARDRNPLDLVSSFGTISYSALGYSIHNKSKRDHVLTLKNGELKDFVAKHSDILYHRTDIDDGTKRGRNLKLGLTLQVVFLSIMRSLGKTSAYLSASNNELVPYYARTGWLVSTKTCGENDPIEEAFKEMKIRSDKSGFVTDEKNRVEKTGHGYKMRLCDFNVDKLKDTLMTSLRKAYIESGMHRKFVTREMLGSDRKGSLMFGQEDQAIIPHNWK